MHDIYNLLRKPYNNADPEPGENGPKQGLPPSEREWELAVARKMCEVCERRGNQPEEFCKPWRRYC